MGVALRGRRVPRGARRATWCSRRTASGMRPKPTRWKRRAPDLPDRIARHSLAARLFHWVMAASMFTLLFTAFLPIAGIRFAWVTWHWMAGLVLTASILFHVVHATVLARLLVDLGRAEGSSGAQGRDPARARSRRPRSQARASIRSATASTTSAIVVAALSVIATGLFMMVRVRTPFFTRNPYLLSDATWGVDVRDARHGGRRARRPRHRARLLRRASGEVVDHEVDDPRLDHAPPVSRASRSGSVGDQSFGGFGRVRGSFGSFGSFWFRGSSSRLRTNRNDSN